MSGALRLGPPLDPTATARGEDIGDVLASIRRLIAQQAPPATAETAPPPPEGDATAAPLSPARTAALTSALADAVDAAAARMAETARRVGEVRETDIPPFRLGPDALIPGSIPGPRARLAVVGETEPADAAAVRSGAADLPTDPPPLAGGAADRPDAPTDHATPDPVVPLLSASTPMEQDGKADPVPPATATDAPVARPSHTEPRMDPHPLRHLLRDAIREELRAEMAERLDTDLRRLVREELAAALTEAFGKTQG